MMFKLLVSVFGAMSVSLLCSGEAAADPRPGPRAHPGPQPAPGPQPKPDPKAQPGPEPEPDPYFGIGISAFANPGVSHHYSHGQQQSCHSHYNNLLGVYPHCYSVSKFCRIMVARPYLLTRLSGLNSYFRKYCHYNVNQNYGIGGGYQGGLGQGGLGHGGLGIGALGLGQGGGLGLGQGGLGLGQGGLGSGGLGHGHHGGGGLGYYDDYLYNDYDHGHGGGGGYIYPDYGIGAYGRAGYGY